MHERSLGELGWRFDRYFPRDMEPIRLQLKHAQLGSGAATGVKEGGPGFRIGEGHRVNGLELVVAGNQHLS